MGSKLFARPFAVFAAAALLLLPFQNCSAPRSATGTSASTDAKGNGDGYGGKTTYIDLALDGSCGSPTAPRSEIDIDNLTGIATLVRDNCQPVTPTVVQVSDQMPHNPNYLTHAGRLFQTASEPTTSLLCRGDGLPLSDGSKNVMDGMVRFGSPGESASVKVGQYAADGSLIRVYEALDTPVVESVGTLGFRIISGVNSAGNEIFELHLNQVNGQWQGFMVYITEVGTEPTTPDGSRIQVPRVVCHEP